MNFFSPDSFWFWVIPSLFLAGALYGFVFYRSPRKKISLRKTLEPNQSPIQKKNISEESGLVQQGSVFFGAGSSELDSEFVPFLNLLGKSLKERKDWKLQIDGWTDRFGNPATNRRLSFERAKRIQSYLCGKWALSASQIQIQGMGVEPRSIGADKARRADWKLIL